jgi:hypothetical protein
MQDKRIYDPLLLVKDFLKQNGLLSTLECLDKEWRYKKIGSKSDEVFKL